MAAPKIQEFFWQDCRNRRLATMVSVLLLLYLAHKIYVYVRTLWMIDYNDFLFTELLINYAGGFVRRGLTGEILYNVCEWLGCHPVYLVVPLVTAAYLGVLAFFFVYFVKRRFCWWLLVSPLILGSTGGIIRKDFIMVLFFIAVIGVLFSRRAKFKEELSALILLTGILCHETLALWGMPIYLLLLFSKTRITRALLPAACVVAVAAISFYFKGTEDIAHSIVDSWNPLMDGVLTYEKQNSIGALGWDTVDTFKMHLRLNFYRPWHSHDVAGIRLLFFCAVYYMMVNFLFNFRRDVNGLTEKDRTNLSAVYILQSLCLLPMFLFLSCDYIRIYQYLLMSSLATFLLVPRDSLAAAFPAAYLKLVATVNNGLEKWIVPTKGLMVGLLFVLRESVVGYYPEAAFEGSVIGFYLTELNTVIRSLI